ncbi:MAG: hypothetical protein OER04_02005 [Cyclobacteriaceae bacterium]|nr:hypothetical protein [Cyclobacteriaceae bacterium]
MGQGNYERKWHQAFEGAEIIPPEKLWTGIEASIANGEVAKYKRRAFYYKWLAAAGIVLFAGLLGYLAYQSSSVTNSSETTVTDRSDFQESTPSKETQKSNSGDQRPDQTTDQTSDHTPDQTLDQAAELSQTSDQEESASLSEGFKGEDIQDTNEQQVKQSQETLLSQTNRSEKDRAVIAESGQDQVGEPQDQGDRSDLLAGKHDENDLDATEKEAVSLENSELLETNPTNYYNTDAATTAEQQLLALNPLTPRQQSLTLSTTPSHIYGVALQPTSEPEILESKGLWAGISLAPGQFDPNYRQGNERALNSPAFDQVTGSSFTPSEETSRGFSFSLAVDLGMKLSPRWEVTSGLQYFRNNVQSSTNAVIGQTPVFSSVVESLDLRNSSGALAFAPTDLDNDFQFISIPLQAGYIVLDKKIQLTINAGLAADIFLKNTISPSDASLESVTINPGSDSPYRTVYFNGIVGLQASYEILPRYSITLQPQYKIAINEFTKPDNTYSSLPASIGIGVGIKYNFK